MYESFYGLNAKPFQLKPDPGFFYGSKGHKRAMAYLEYGLSQGEGFIIITGEVGAGKTTLMRNLFRTLKPEEVVASQIVNTHLDADEILRTVVAGFGLPHENASKATLILELENFLRRCDQQGKRALLVVDEAQNLAVQTLEELRMLSNFQTDDKPLLQTFLLGQPEFKKILLGDNMQQLRQRVIATYHLGPMDIAETQAYILHRLNTVGWNNDPAFEQNIFAIIHEYTGGIPRKINLLCDRMLIMGYLEELHQFGQSEVAEVIADFQEEFDASSLVPDEQTEVDDQAHISNEHSLKAMDDRIEKMEKSVISVLDLLKQVLALPNVRNSVPKDKME